MYVIKRNNEKIEKISYFKRTCGHCNSEFIFEDKECNTFFSISYATCPVCSTINIVKNSDEISAEKFHELRQLCDE